ncbi:unnamed protein product [Eruca vesicaria subsp. sativa]|uniref:Uncharacterized protein n=1 Tax=Eruca vesicaria subsp. sativa TaxID=29727 RepID=A0ABC8JEJ2_ERUVS|nr:unnamed protein product [Eruca vesicaria subsp. sativa]
MAQPSSFVLTAPQGKDMYGPWDLSSLIDQNFHLGVAPFTKEYFGAVRLGSLGIAYLCVNVKFTGLSLYLSIDTEKFLVANLVLNSKPHLTDLAISSDDTNFVAPCKG